MRLIIEQFHAVVLKLWQATEILNTTSSHFLKKMSRMLRKVNPTAHEHNTRICE